MIVTYHDVFGGEISRKDILEALVDRMGILSLTTLLQEICQDKADHIRANWQDEWGAVRWEMKAKALEKIPIDILL